MSRPSAISTHASHVPHGSAVGPSTQLSARLEPAFRSIERLADDPLVVLGIRDLTNTTRILDPTLATLTPVQSVCNYITLWFRNVSSLLSEGGSNGTTQRFIIIATPQGPNSEGGPSSRPANGPSADNHLHTDPYPHTGAPGQPKECEAGNEPYAIGKTVTSSPPGVQSDRTEGNP